MGWLHEHLIKCGVHVIGYWPTEARLMTSKFQSFVLKIGCCFVGSPSMKDCEPELSDQRISPCLSQIAVECSRWQAKSAA